MSLNVPIWCYCIRMETDRRHTVLLPNPLSIYIYHSSPQQTQHCKIEQNSTCVLGRGEQ